MDAVEEVKVRIKKYAKGLSETDRARIYEFITSIATQHQSSPPIGFKYRGRQLIPAILVQDTDDVFEQALKIPLDTRGKLVIESIGTAQSHAPGERVAVPPSPDLKPGRSIGHPQGFCMSIGASVTYRIPGAERPLHGLITAAHGLPASFNRGEHFLSPGPPDTIDRYYAIGHYSRGTALSVANNQHDRITRLNTTDISIVELTNDALSRASNEVPHPQRKMRERGHQLHLTHVADESELYDFTSIGKQVSVVGRTSGFVSGNLVYADVLFLSLRAGEQYHFYTGVWGIARKNKCITKSGDSGAPVYIFYQKGKAKLLGFVIGATPDITWFLPADRAFKEFNVKLRRA